MDVLRLDPETFLPDVLVEGYDSMIWTERFIPIGEFSMKTGDIDRIKNLLPKGSFISLRDSREVMIVEDHLIEPDDNGGVTLTVTGRTISSILETRVTETYINSDIWKIPGPIPGSYAIALIVWNSVANDTGADVTRTWGITTEDVLSNVLVSISAELPWAVKDWWMKADSLYAQVLDFQIRDDIGLRAIRPPTASIMMASIDRRGYVNRLPTTDVSALLFDTYIGIDRSRDQSLVNPVIFDYNSGHFDNASYLSSIKDYRTRALVLSSLGGFQTVYADALLSPYYTGFDRRSMLIDGGSPNTGESSHDFFDRLIQVGETELKKHNNKILFDASVSLENPYHYNEDYFLGDKITLSAQYGVFQTMRVSEYVRTEDSSGDRGYPTLTVVT